ncbi:MAG: DUF3822 family protein [Bacteroidetes bacterium]|nr:DUF3822 family protein [Bacteroidota bacterium]
MSSEITINHTSFGQSFNSADTLVIELSENLIQFCELESAQNKPLFICDYPIENILKHTLSEHFISAIKHFQFLKKQYLHVYINYFTQQFTLCPTAFYNSDSNRSMLEFNTGSIDNKLILVDDVTTDIKLIYGIDESLKSTLDLIFPNHQLKHSLSVLSKLMLVSEELVKEHILFIYSLKLHRNCCETRPKISISKSVFYKNTRRRIILCSFYFRAISIKSFNSKY